MAQKDDSDRRRLSAYPRVIEVRALFSDMDVFKHINNNALGRYFEEGRADLNMRIFGEAILIDPPPGTQLLFANTGLDFLGQARYPGTLSIATGISRIGNSSFTFAQAAFQQGEAVALAEAVVVKAESGRPVPLSERERAIIRGLLLLPDGDAVQPAAAGA